VYVEAVVYEGRVDLKLTGSSQELAEEIVRQVCGK